MPCTYTTEAGILYSNMLAKCHDGKVESEIIYPSDKGYSNSDVDLTKYHGVAWTGCSLCVYDEKDERVKKQLELAKMAYKVGVPQFGSCKIPSPSFWFRIFSSICDA